MAVVGKHIFTIAEMRQDFPGKFRIQKRKGLDRGGMQLQFFCDANRIGSQFPFRRFRGGQILKQLNNRLQKWLHRSGCNNLPKPKIVLYR
ncbi:hypothetical protein B0B52_10330 [Polaromonas sp. A23]|nr:hypothetical protein B0B52_10330 [Polaromonas sp. A23]